MLDLEVSDFDGMTSWRWQLRDERGEQLAEHTVRLDGRTSEFDLLLDLYRGLWRLDVDLERRSASARQLFARVGSYVSNQLLGGIAGVLSLRAPVTVNLRLPAAAVLLSSTPLELATVDGRSLVELGVVFCHVDASATRHPPLPSGRPLRVLAIYALPDASSALGLVSERRSLTTLMRDLADSGELELHSLQYGATRKSLTSALADPAGWDVVHLSGHGGRGRMFLETADGGRDSVLSRDLLPMFEPCAGRARLVVLSACESGAMRALRRKGGSQQSGTSGPVADLSPWSPAVLPSLGHELSRQLGCAVLAMRYPVDDRFSIAFSRLWYEASLRDGQPLHEALRRAVRAAWAVPALPLLSAATPVLWGPSQLRVAAADAAPRRRRPSTSQARRRVAASSLPPAPDMFVGRTSVIGRIGALLAQSATVGAVLVVGAPGVGKSACVSEAAHWYADRFGAIGWHKVSRRDSALSLARAAARLVGVSEVAEVPSDSRDSAPAGPALLRATRLLILDDVQRLLTADGRWLDPAVGALIATWCRPGGRMRLILISDRPIAAAMEQVSCLPMPYLSRSESEWLARECQERSWGQVGVEVGRPVGLPWLVCHGQPQLIQHCSIGSASLALRRARTLDRAWEVSAPTPPPGVPGGRPTLGKAHPGAAVTRWARDRAPFLPPESAAFLGVLSSLERVDRINPVLDTVWELLREEIGIQPVRTELALAPLLAAGLAEKRREHVLVHHAVARAGRDLSERIHNVTVTVAGIFWTQQYEQGAQDAARTSEHSLGQVAALCVPYLMRSAQWESASARCEQAINHDRSPTMAARILPFATEIVRGTVGSSLEFATRYVRATILLVLSPERGIAELQRLHARAFEAGDDKVVVACASTFVQALSHSRPQQAYEWLQRAMSTERQASMGPWASLQIRLNEGQLLSELGSPREALQRMDTLLADAERLQQRQIPPSHVNPHGLLIAALEVAASAASTLGRQSDEVKYRSQATEISRRQESAERDVARLQFNRVHLLIKAGQLDEAQNLLLAARAHFSNPGDEGHLGLVLIELAELSHLRRHDQDAVELGRQAIRASYLANEWLDAARWHQRMATFAAASKGEVSSEAPLHLLAAAVIHLRESAGLLAFTGPPDVIRALALVTFCLARRPVGLPETLDQLRTRLIRECGADLQPLIETTERVPLSINPDGRPVFSLNDSRIPGDSLTDVLTWARHLPPPGDLLDIATHPEHWEEIADQVAAAARHHEDGVEPIRELLDALRGAGWGDLATAFEQIVRGDSPTALSGSLAPPERAIVESVTIRLGDR